MYQSLAFALPHFNLRLALDRGVADGVHEALAADAHLPLAPPLVLPPLPARHPANLSSLDMASAYSPILPKDSSTYRV